MKVFIVFLALLMVFSMFLVYRQDMIRYMQVQKLLKFLAEDAAEAGALCIDVKDRKIDGIKAVDAAEEIIAASSLFPEGSVRITSWNITRDGLGFYLALEYSSEDLFRSVFTDIRTVSRSSEYAWE